MDDNVRMTGGGKPVAAPGAASEAGPVTRRRALGDIGINVSAPAPAGGKPVAKPVSLVSRAWSPLLMRSTLH